MLTTMGSNSQVPCLVIACWYLDCGCRRTCLWHLKPSSPAVAAVCGVGISRGASWYFPPCPHRLYTCFWGRAAAAGTDKVSNTYPLGGFLEPTRCFPLFSVLFCRTGGRKGGPREQVLPTAFSSPSQLQLGAAHRTWLQTRG